MPFPHPSPKARKKVQNPGSLNPQFKNPKERETYEGQQPGGFRNPANRTNPNRPGRIAPRPDQGNRPTPQMPLKPRIAPRPEAFGKSQLGQIAKMSPEKRRAIQRQLSRMQAKK